MKNLIDIKEDNKIIKEINKVWIDLNQKQKELKNYKYLYKKTDNFIKDFFHQEEIKNKNSNISKLLSSIYFTTYKLYELIIEFIKEKNKLPRDYQEINLNIIQKTFNDKNCKNPKENTKLLINFIKFRNSISHTIFFKLYIFYILNKSQKECLIDDDIKYEEIENEYKQYFINLKPLNYKELLKDEFDYIKQKIKEIKNNEISKTAFIESVELSLINIYQAIVLIHFKNYNHNHIKQTIFEIEDFTKEDMKAFKFLHEFKHHTIHENRKMADQFQKFNIIKKLIPSPEYKRNKTRQKTNQNLITLIKEFFEKLEKIENNN
jgi:hypothetical protein